MNSKIRVKICGITDIADMDTCVRHGVHYAGLMFFEKSPRFLNLNLARKLSLHAGDQIKKVGVTVNLDNLIIDKILEKVPLDFIQLHGQEPPERVRAHEITATGGWSAGGGRAIRRLGPLHVQRVR